MTWVRLDDMEPGHPVWEGLAPSAFHFYFLIVAHCSRTEVYDCDLPLRAVEGLAITHGIDSPDVLLKDLAAAGRVVVEDKRVIIVDGERRHMLPKSKREKKRQADQRRWTADHRQRQCEQGIHSRHCPESCPMRIVEGKGVGKALPRDRTGQDAVREGSSEVESEEFCFVCGGLESDLGCSPAAGCKAGRDD